MVKFSDAELGELGFQHFGKRQIDDGSKLTCLALFSIVHDRAREVLGEW